jgi:RNA polymerase sigma-70 factor, ECF subfamily
MPAADEQLLLSQARDGSHAAYRVLMERHMKQAYNVAFGFVNDHDIAHDVAQEAFVRAYRSLSSFRGDAGFGTWLHRIVANLSMNQLKQMRTRARREVALDVAEPLIAMQQPGHEHASDVREHIERALHELPTLQRAVVILRHIDGLSTRQVSDILRISEGTVKTHLFRGLRNLRKRLEFLQEST